MAWKGADFINCRITIGGEEVKPISSWELFFDYRRNHAEELTIEELLDIVDKKMDNR
jgi:hypothetical protein